LSVDLMMVIGIVLILQHAKSYVDFSLKSFFGFPSIALILGLGFCFAFELRFSLLFADLPEAILKFSIFSVIYICIMIFFDRKEINSVLNVLKKYL